MSDDDAVYPSRDDPTNAPFGFYRLNIILIAVCWHFYHAIKPTATSVSTSRIFPYFHTLATMWANVLFTIYGYFGAASVGFSSRGLIHLWFSLHFYIQLGLIYAFSYEIGNWWERAWWITRFPVLGEAYDFFTRFFTVSIVVPGINEVVRGLSSRQNIVSFSIALFMEVVSCGTQNVFFHGGWSPMHFGVIYFMAGCVRMREFPLWLTAKLAVAFALFRLHHYVITHNISWILRGGFSRFRCGFERSGPAGTNAAAVLCIMWLLTVHRSIKLPSTIAKLGSWFGVHAFGILLMFSNPVFGSIRDAYFFRLTEERTGTELHDLFLFTFICGLIGIAVEAIRTEVFLIIEEVLMGVYQRGLAIWEMIKKYVEELDLASRWDLEEIDQI